jgi:glucose-6-phosphate 1-dehydrogenase
MFVLNDQFFFSLSFLTGDHNLFVRVDELQAAWRIFTPVLHQLEKERIAPILYPFGSRGPPEADQLAYKYGISHSYLLTNPNHDIIVFVWIGFVRVEGYHWPGNQPKK